MFETPKKSINKSIQQPSTPKKGEQGLFETQIKRLLEVTDYSDKAKESFFVLFRNISE